MAFQHGFEDPHGVAHGAAYSKVVRLHYEDYGDDEEVSVVFAIYKDAMAKAAGKVPVGHEAFSLRRSTNPVLYDAYFSDAAQLGVDVSPKRAVYNLVKQQSLVATFAGAIDV